MPRGQFLMALSQRHSSFPSKQNLKNCGVEIYSLQIKMMIYKHILLSKTFVLVKIDSF